MKLIGHFIKMASPALFIFHNIAISEELTWHEIAYRVIKNNSALKVRQFTPKQKKESLQIAQSGFDPQLKAVTKHSKTKGTGELQVTTPLSQSTFDNQDQLSNLDLSIEKKLNYGTQLRVNGTLQKSDSDLDSQNISFKGREDYNSFSIGLEQPLLDGRGKEIQETHINQANLELNISNFELSAFTETLVFNSLIHALDLYSKLETIEVLKKSILLEKEELKHIQLKVKHGKLTKVDLLAAEASLATRKQDLSIWKTLKDHSRLDLIHSFTPNSKDLWELDITFPTYSIPSWAQKEIKELHLSSALKNRSDLKQAKLLLQHNNLSINLNKNKLLPTLNFFTNIGYQDYQRRDAFNSIDTKGDGFQYQAGLSLQLSLSKKKDQATLQIANFTRLQTQESIKNLEGLIARDIHKAYNELESFKEQLEASKKVVALRQQILKDEQLKRDLGTATSLDVLRARNEVLEGQKIAIETKINEFKTRLLLFYRDGSLLTRLNLKI